MAKVKVTAADDPNVSALNTNHFSIVACSAIAGYTKSATKVCVGETLDFINTSANALTYDWQIDAVTESSDTDFSRTFNEAGTFILRLVATNTGGCSDVYDEVIVVNPLPDAEFADLFDGQLLHFGTMGDNDGMEYLWDFGDGATATDAQVSHAYASDGTYNVCLTVNDVDGCGNDQYCKNVSYAPCAALPQCRI